MWWTPSYEILQFKDLNAVDNNNNNNYNFNAHFQITDFLNFYYVKSLH